jgi:hypothetical protein
MLEFLLAALAAVRVFLRSRQDTALEILALRQQLDVLKRKRPRPRLNPLDRLFWTALRRIWSRWAEVLVVVKPQILSPAIPAHSRFMVGTTARAQFDARGPQIPSSSPRMAPVSYPFLLVSVTCAARAVARS